MSIPALNEGCCAARPTTRQADASTITNVNRFTSGSRLSPGPCTTHRHASARRRHLGPLGSNERLRASVHDFVLRRQFTRQPLQRVVKSVRTEQRDALAARTTGARIQQEGAFSRRVLLRVIEL